MKCEYGCGQVAKHQLKNGRWCCSKYPTICPAVRKKNSDGIKKAHADGRIPGWYELLGDPGAWERGQTKETNDAIRRRAEERMRRINEGEILPPFDGKKLSEEHKKALHDGLEIYKAGGKKKIVKPKKKPLYKEHQEDFDLLNIIKESEDE